MERKEQADELIKAYELYNSHGSEYLGLLETSAVKYCLRIFDRKGNLVPPRTKLTETSKLCNEIIKIVNKTNEKVARLLISDSENAEEDEEDDEEFKCYDEMGLCNWGD